MMIAGIFARTNNALEMAGLGVIADMWQRVMSDHVIETIPNRADESIIALYTDYESDSDGDYTFLIGAEVASVDHDLPDGIAVRHVPAGVYTLLTSDEGPIWEVV